MPYPRTIIHPKLFTEMPQFFPSRCSIYPLVQVRNPLGELIATPPDEWLDGAEPIIEDIPCIIADLARPVETEIRTPDSTYIAVARRLMLSGFYPEIDEHMRAVVDGVVYDIRGVDPSAVGSHTELVVEVVSI